MNGIDEIETSLRELGAVEAPPNLLPEVMLRLNLADRYVPMETPLGPVFVAWNERGISAVMRGDAETFEPAFRAEFGRPAFPRTMPERLQREVMDALAGKRKPRVDLRGLTEFEQAVLRKALEIPRGEIRPYGWIAREIGRPAAVRAVGSALARNPIPLLIPCHRVVRSDGKIGNYGLGGPANKRTILAAEGVDPEEVERLAQAGIRFIGSETTRIYCFPTCRHARRVQGRYRRPFASAPIATSAGYRPCQVCRPA